MTELAGRLAVVKVSGDPLDLSGEALEHVTDTEWRIADIDKRVIDRDVDPVLQWDDSGWVDIEHISVNRLSGTFTFAAPGYADTESLRVKTTAPTAKYLPLSTAAFAHNYSYNRGVDLMDVTPFRVWDADTSSYVPVTHRKRIKGQKFASGTINQWDVIDSYFGDALTDGSPVVLEFRGQDAGDPQRVWALLESAEMTAAIDSPQDEAVSFISTDELLNIS